MSINIVFSIDYSDETVMRTINNSDNNVLPFIIHLIIIIIINTNYLYIDQDYYS